MKTVKSSGCFTLKPGRGRDTGQHAPASNLLVRYGACVKTMLALQVVFLQR
jgi:hypothetical protein